MCWVPSFTLVSCSILRYRLVGSMHTLVGGHRRVLQDERALCYCWLAYVADGGISGGVSVWVSWVDVIWLWGVACVCRGGLAVSWSWLEVGMGDNSLSVLLCVWQ